MSTFGPSEFAMVSIGDGTILRSQVAGALWCRATREVTALRSLLELFYGPLKERLTRV
jgi:hypothetical protein